MECWFLKPLIFQTSSKLNPKSLPFPSVKHCNFTADVLNYPSLQTNFRFPWRFEQSWYYRNHFGQITTNANNIADQLELWVKQCHSKLLFFGFALCCCYLSVLPKLNTKIGQLIQKSKLTATHAWKSSTGHFCHSQQALHFKLSPVNPVLNCPWATHIAVL